MRPQRQSGRTVLTRANNATLGTFSLGNTPGPYNRMTYAIRQCDVSFYRHYCYGGTCSCRWPMRRIISPDMRSAPPDGSGIRRSSCCVGSVKTRLDPRR
jgi:hypothetical protein